MYISTRLQVRVIVVTPYPLKSHRHLSQFAIKIRNFENFKLGTDFEKAHPSAAVSRIDGAGFPVNVPYENAPAVFSRNASVALNGCQGRMAVKIIKLIKATSRVDLTARLLKKGVAAPIDKLISPTAMKISSRNAREESAGSLLITKPSKS